MSEDPMAFDASGKSGSPGRAYPSTARPAKPSHSSHPLIVVVRARRAVTPSWYPANRRVLDKTGACAVRWSHERLVRWRTVESWH